MTRKKSVQPLRIIAIPDSHAKPNTNSDRFEWLGKLICDYKPTTIVNIGDLFDMPSLSTYDRGGKSFEGRRYHKDIAAGIEALDRIEKTVLRTKWGKANYEGIDKHFCMGHHEARINRVLNATAEYEGLISYDDLKLEEHRYTVHPYLEAVCRRHSKVFVECYTTLGSQAPTACNKNPVVNRARPAFILLKWLLAHILLSSVSSARPDPLTRISTTLTRFSGEIRLNNSLASKNAPKMSSMSPKEVTAALRCIDIYSIR